MEPAEQDHTSWSLILGAAAGGPLARDTFSQRYGPLIRSYLAARWRLPADHDAVADATNDVFVECFKEQGALTRVDSGRPGGFRAFLYGVVRNVALMAERRWARTRDRPTGADLDSLEQSEATLSQVFDREWAHLVMQQAREIMAARASSSPAAGKRFRVLSLRFEKQLPPRDIAAQMNLAVERVYEMLKEARVEFRVALLQVMSTYHPGAPEAEIEARCVELLRSLA